MNSSVFLKISFSLLLTLVFQIGSIAQVNESTKENYRVRETHLKYAYATNYDNGYITLRDGTTLYGKISLVGKSFDKLSAVIIRTNSGKRYSLNLRSISKFGLTNSLTNDTPDLFTWVQMNEKSVVTGYQDIRTGTCSFGYVKTQDGKTFEGELTVKEINGRIKDITVKNGDKKDKLDADVIKNFGVQRYVDPKFAGVWSVVQWRKSIGTGILVNTKSIPAIGAVTLNDGSVSKGYITIVKKNEITTQLRVSETLDSKEAKIKYNDVKSYVIEQKMSDYIVALKNSDEPLEEIHPARSFHPGAFMLLDGTIIKGQIAKASNSDYSDIFYAKDENSIIKGYSAEELEGAIQDIPENELKQYTAAIYDRDHAQDFLIQRPAQWKYSSKTENITITEFQQGYIILPSGEEKVGALQVTKNGSFTTLELIEGEVKNKYRDREFVEYGLIDNQPHTAFRAGLYSGMFKKKVPGFIKLLGSDEIIKGDLKIRTSTNGFNGNSEEIMMIDDKKYKLETIEYYGLIDVPVSEINRNGSLIHSDSKVNFHPGSFNYNGNKKEGFIAWAEPNGSGKSNAILFAESMEGVANVFYLKDGATDIVQNIPDVIEEEKLAIDTVDAEQEFKGKGYILKTNGEKLEGEIHIVYPPGTWFSPEVALLKTDSSSKVFTKDPSIKSVFIEIDGKQKEFLNYKNVLVEVLERDSTLVLFRNPFPTIETLGSKLLNQLIQGKQDDFNAEQEQQAAVAEAEGRIEVQVTLNFAEIKIYALENLIYDESTGRVTMYAPAPNFYLMVDAELSGCIEYLTMSWDEKNSLRRMKNPLETIKFLNENMNN